MIVLNDTRWGIQVTVSENREKRRPESDLCISDTHLPGGVGQHGFINPRSMLSRRPDEALGPAQREALQITEGGRMKAALVSIWRLTLVGPPVSLRALCCQHSWSLGSVREEGGSL